MIDDAVAHFKSQVEAPAVLFEHVDDAQRLDIVRKSVRSQTVQNPLARVPERRVPQIVPQSDRFRQVFIESEGTGDGARDLRNVDGVRHAGAEMVAFRRKEDLRLIFQTQERLAVNNAVAVALKGGTHIAFLFRALPAFRIFRFAGEFGQKLLFDGISPFFDGKICHLRPLLCRKRRNGAPPKGAPQHFLL